MHALGYLVISLAEILHLIFNLYTFIIAGAVIVSWVGADPYNPIVRFLRQATEPIFSHLRRHLPSFLFRTGIDFTPMVLILLLVLLKNILGGLLVEWGQKLLIQ